MTSYTPWSFWNFVGFLPAKTPTRLQTTTLQIQPMALQHQSRINRTASVSTTRASIRESHKAQTDISFTRLGHEMRPQKLQDHLCLPRHGNPRIAAIYSGLLGRVILKGTSTHNFTKAPNGLLATHRDFYSQSVRRVYNILAPRGPDITNRNAAFAIKQPGCPSN